MNNRKIALSICNLYPQVGGGSALARYCEGGNGWWSVAGFVSSAYDGDNGTRAKAARRRAQQCENVCAS